MYDPAPLLSLAASLGYVETPELVAARETWQTALGAGSPHVGDLAIAYQDLAQALDAEVHRKFDEGRTAMNYFLLSDREPSGPDQAEATAVKYATAMGFKETPELVAQRNAVRSNPADSKAYGAYLSLADKLAAELGARFQIGLLIAKATVYGHVGNIGYYQDDLDEARECARLCYFDDVVARIGAELATFIPPT